MCGIIGLIHADPETSGACAEEIFLGLQNLQHRGQDGGGIVTCDDGELLVHRGSGLLDLVFPAENFKRLKGLMGVGHTRYATVGQKDGALLQPFVSHAAKVTIAHNGNLLNYHTLLDEIRRDHPEALASGCDSEVILWYIEQAFLVEGRTPEVLLNAVKQLSRQLVGSYSVIGVAEGIGLFAFRDPHGLRPLVMGKRQDSTEVVTAVASESMALSFTGFDDFEDIAPGELVIVPPAGGGVQRFQYTSASPRHCMFEWVYFARVESDVESLPVYKARFNLGLSLAKTIEHKGLKPDIVVPVPETSRIAAIALAESLGVPFREVLIKNRYVNRTFILESQQARQEAIRRKLYPVASELVGKKVLIVDDSIVRGNTAIKIIELLRKSGAEEIYLASTCPPIVNPCFYGIDFPEKEELLASEGPIETLRSKLGVDALIYQTMPGLAGALSGLSLCDACLTGDYPTSIDAAERFAQERHQEREVVSHG